MNLVKSEAKPLSVLSAEQVKSVKRINSYHKSFKAAFSQQMGYAFLSGLELNALKESLQHGDFMAFCKEHLDVTKSSVQRYMAFTAEVLPQITHVGNLPPGGNGEVKLLTNGKLTKEAKKGLVEAVYKLADGKTLTQMYRDTGVIRQPQKQQHTPSTITEEDKLTAKIEQSKALMNAVNDAINTLLCHGSADPDACYSYLMDCSPAEREMLAANCVRLTTTIREMKKGGAK